ncbi:MAG: gliding motility-associated-like protein [Flavobacteriales bacterium]|jgi:gliding motility-associated-like protein
MKHLIILVLLTIACQLFSQSTHYKLVENKGQWPSSVLGRAEIEIGWVWFEDDGFTFHLADYSEVSALHTNSKAYKKGKPSANVYGHVYHLDYLGANKTQVPSWGNLQPAYHNFFLGNDPALWKGNCRAFGQMTYPGLYDGIDLKLHSSDFFLKYVFIVQPGADASQIAWQYRGAKAELVENRLVVRNTVADITEQKPIAWQIIDGVKTMVSCEFVLNEDICSFNFPDGYNSSYELIIDPELIFSTYSGSTADNFGYTATFDSDGFLYSGSSAFGAGYPYITGSYEESWGGGDGQGTLVGTDIAISKYDTTGTFMVYSTYLGGSADELPHSLIVNEDDELIVYGTTSSNNYPITGNAYDQSFGGGDSFAPSGVGVDYVNGSDIIVTMFNEFGSDLVTSTFLGGTGNDGVNTAPDLKFNYADEVRGEVMIDNEGNVYVVSCTYSTNFPVVNGFQVSNAGGLDACITKFDPELENILWSSYMGGIGDDAAYSIAVDSNNDIYVCGGTETSILPIPSTGWQNASNGGLAEGYIIKVDGSGSAIQKGTYVGSTAYDQVYFVEVDNDNVVYAYGQTRAANNYWIENAGYSQSNSGMLVMKMDSDLENKIWSTVFGTGAGKPNLSPTAFLVDICGKVYMSGWGGTTNTSSNSNTATVEGMETTDDAYQALTNDSDFYLIILENDGSDVVYASFFGGLESNEHVDGGTSRFSEKGVIYQSVCAGCGSNDDFPIVPFNAVSPTNNSTNCNNGVFKFDFQLPITIAEFSAPNQYCQNAPVGFNNGSTFGQNFTWDFGDESSSNASNPFHSYEEPGIYEITLVANHPGTCNQTDTVVHTIEIIVPTVTDISSIEVCDGEPTYIGVGSTPGYIYEWTPGTYLSEDNVADPIFTAGDDTDYVLTIIHDGCIDTVYQDVAVNTILLELPADLVLCESEIIDLDAITDGEAIIWSEFEDFSIVLNDNDQDTDIDIYIEENITLYAQASTGECLVTDSVTVSLIGTQTDISADIVACGGDTITVQVINPSDQLDYTWSPNNLVLTGQGTPSVEVIVNETTWIYLESVYNNECTALDSAFISISGLNPLSIDATADPNLISSGESSQLNVIPFGYGYTWTPGEFLNNSSSDSPIATLEETTMFYVIVSDGECEHLDSVRVTVVDFVCGPPSIYIPNAFSPNGDDQNEILFIRGENLTSVYLTIYDRWGEMVFETSSQNIGWDGTYKGKPVDPAVFVYYLEATCVGGVDYFDKGNITVIK